MSPTKLYKPEQMSNAIKEVRRGTSVFAASKKFGVPRITLRNKITGKSPVSCGMGPPSILTKDQENKFVQWLNTMSDKHCPVAKEHLIDSVEYFVTQNKIVNPFTDNRPGKKWFYSFVKRHPEVSERLSQNWTRTKDNVTEQKIKSWFSHIYEYLTERKLHNVIKDPSRIFTSDEAAFYLNPKQGRALVKRNETNIYSVIANDKENPKVLLTANAAGDLAPPMVLFSYQRIPTNISDSIPEEWGVGRSKTGWTCGNTLYEYMTNVFHPWLIENKIKLPVIYFLDGDATHLTLHLTKFCSKNQIELLALYPNSNYVLKPMDVAVFRPLKVFWKKQCNRDIKNLNHEIKKENFGPILQRALNNITPDCIRNGFKVGGLYPFGPKEIDFTKLKTIKCQTMETDPNAILFFNTLEKEIVEHFTLAKIDAFTTYFKNEHNPRIDLPKEDLILYTIWAKYKHLCHGGAENCEEAAESSFEHEISPNERITQIRRISSSDNSEESDSEDVKPSYLELNIESVDQNTPYKLLPSTSFKKRLLRNTIKESPTEKSRPWPDDKEKKSTRAKKTATLTVKEWRELNKEQSNKKTTLKQQELSGQEGLRNKRKRDVVEKENQNAKRTKRTIIKQRKMSTSSEDTAETQASFIDYGSDASMKSELLSFFKGGKKNVNGVVEEAQDREISSMELVKREIGDDSVIICVTDNDVNILYY